MRVFVLSMGLLLACAAWAENDDQRAVEYLKGLELEQLPSLELALDETFDVFDGLVRKQTMRAASGFEQSLSRSPAVGTVITAQDIEAMGARTLDEALRAVPGLHVQYSPSSYMPIYVIRGIYTPANPEVLIMVDGMPVKSLENGAPGLAWVHIPVHHIARIEVVRGPGSAVYGADAFAGVIDIITKQADDLDGTEAGVRAGSFATQQVWLSHGERYGEVATAFSVDYFTTDGPGAPFERPPEQADLPPLLDLRGHGIGLCGGLAYRDWQVRAAYQRRDDLGHGGLDLLGSYDPASYFDESRLELDVDYTSRAWHPDWQVSTRAGVQENAFSLFFKLRYPGGLYPEGVIIDTHLRERHHRLEFSGLYGGFARHLPRLGVGFYQADMREVQARTNQGFDATGRMILPGSPVLDLSDTPAAFLPETARDNVYLFLQDTWRMHDRWELTAGLRYDDYSDFGTAFNPRLALVWQTTPALTGKLLFGRAFRAPAYRELYMNNNSFIQGNPEVRPEIIDTGEVALDWQAAHDLHAAFNLFYYRAADKIDFLALPNGVARADNAGSWRGHGAEFELRWKLGPRAALLFNYAWAEARNRERSENIEIYPRHQAYLRHDWLLAPAWYMDTQLRWAADRRVVSTISEQTPAQDYWLADLTLRYKSGVESRWSFALGIRNLFDREAYERENVPLPGRNVFIEGRWRF